MVSLQGLQYDLFILYRTVTKPNPYIFKSSYKNICLSQFSKIPDTLLPTDNQIKAQIPQPAIQDPT